MSKRDDNDLQALKQILLKLEDAYWCFNDMPGPDEDDETAVGQEYLSIHEKMEEILQNASVHF